MKLFADSFFFFAYLNPKDKMHEQAEAYFDLFDGTLVTTAWVLTELADGMAASTIARPFSASTMRFAMNQP